MGVVWAPTADAGAPAPLTSVRVSAAVCRRFLEGGSQHLGTGGKSCTDNGGHKGVTISTDESVKSKEGVGGTGEG